MFFEDRYSAGRQLAVALQKYADEDIILFALPRGGVVVGKAIAEIFGKNLELALPRKIAHPHSPEYAICAVGEKGTVICHEEARKIDFHWLEQETKKQVSEIARRRESLLSGKERPMATDKTAILIDDGMATGLTMRAAIHDIKPEDPEKIVVAVPISSLEAIKEIGDEADEIEVLYTPAGPFNAIGSYYENFPQMNDEEVREYLTKVTS